jgi:hypothetical protein
MKGLRVLDRNMEEAFVSLIPPAQSFYPNTRSMPQWRTEEILADRLTALDVEVERRVTAQEITTSENAVQEECLDNEGRAFECGILYGASLAWMLTRKVTSGSMLDLALFQCPIIGF